MNGDYYHTKASVDEYIQLAKGVNGKELIQKLEKHLKPNADVLEIGSGPGTDWNILKDSFNVTGSDYSTEFLIYLTSQNPSHVFLQLDAVTLNTNKKFDGIYSNKVLHHLTNHQLINSIKRQYDTLTTNGIVCHSFWKGEGSEFFKGLFVNYHDEKSLSTVFKPYFELISIELYEEFEPKDSLLLLAKKRN